MAATIINATIGDAAVRLAVHPDGRVDVADARFTVVTAGPGLYRVSDGTTRATVAVAGPADARWVSIAGHTFVVDISGENGTRGRRARGGHGSLAAPMPATVVKLLASPGDTVAEGDTLVVLEAMKMELPIRAPRAGRVAKVECQVGELVQPGVPLIEIDDA